MLNRRAHLSFSHLLALVAIMLDEIGRDASKRIDGAGDKALIAARIAPIKVQIASSCERIGIP